MPGATIFLMKLASTIVVALSVAAASHAQNIKRDIPYAGEADEQRTLDV